MEKNLGGLFNQKKTPKFYGPFWNEYKNHILGIIQHSAGLFGSREEKQWANQIYQNMKTSPDTPSLFFKRIVEELDAVAEQWKQESKEFLRNTERKIILYINSELPRTELNSYGLYTLKSIIRYFRDREIDSEHFGKFDFSGDPKDWSVVDRIEKTNEEELSSQINPLR